MNVCILERAKKRCIGNRILREKHQKRGSESGGHCKRTECSFSITMVGKI